MYYTLFSKYLMAYKMFFYKKKMSLYLKRPTFSFGVVAGGKSIARVTLKSNPKHVNKVMITFTPQKQFYFCKVTMYSRLL